MPRMSAEQRYRRDERVYQLWLAGLSLRAIGRQVELSCRGVELALERRLGEIAGEADGRSDITALRLENLLRPLWTKAMAGDLRASEQARRLLMSQARLNGDIPSPRLSSQDRLDERYGDGDLRQGREDGDGNVTALERYRQRRHHGGSS